MDLFALGRKAQIEKESPLANRMRPRTLEEFVGQDHIMGPGRLLRRAIQADQLSSLIFYGPPGTGKTTLAMVIANSTESHFITINAVLSGVKEIREAIATAKEGRNLHGQRTTLFVDEVHRWNKAQQDALLPHVENGTIILIGATTENPYFEVNKALVSRSRIFQLKPLTHDDLRQIAWQALKDRERGYGELNILIAENAIEHLIDVANGDARGVLNALELAVETTPPNDRGAINIDISIAEESIQRRAVLYDKEGDVHYDTISAFIKSLRGSDPDAALYWMAKMVYAGEDPRFIFRRMTIFAGEDVGMADPHAITIVISCWSAFERIGMPEGRFPLAQAAIYLATAPKSNSAFAFFDALETVEEETETDVPNHLKDGNRDQEGFGHGKGYLYPHAYRDHWIAQQYLPESLQGKIFYQPGNLGYEKEIQDQVSQRREAQLAAMVEGGIGAPPEILTNSPTDRIRDIWLQRTVAGVSRTLAHQRDRIFEMISAQRHHLVLNLNAGSGLLTWEAIRRVPEGGVWALTNDQNNADALQQQSMKLNELERPVIMMGNIEELAYLLQLRGEEDIRFDRIIGRNIFTTKIFQINEILPHLTQFLSPAGLLSFSQIMPVYTQRLYKLVDWAGNKSLEEKVSQAEEKIYQDENDSLVNWDENDLQLAFNRATEIKDFFVEESIEERHISEDQLHRWFVGQQAQFNRATYGQRLVEAGLTKKEIDHVYSLFRQSLLSKSVPWSISTAFLTAIPKNG